MAIDRENKPQRRIEDHHQAAKIDWSKPEVPAVVQPAPALATVLTNEQIDTLAKPFASVGGIADYRAFVRSVLAQVGDPLRSAVQQMARALADGEWADLLTTDRDAAALEAEIGKLIERAQAGVRAEPVGWATFGTKDGKQKLDQACLASNPAYIAEHKQWIWQPVYLGQVQRKE
jgi:hypothetical protein